MTGDRSGFFTHTARRVAGAPYVMRWLILAPLIGALAGSAVIALWNLALACTHLLLELAKRVA